MPAHRGLPMRHDCNPLHQSALAHTLHTLGPPLTNHRHYSIQLNLLSLLYPTSICFDESPLVVPMHMPPTPET